MSAPPSPVVIRCPADLTVATAAAFRERLLAAADASVVVLDAADVRRVDGAGLQVMAAAAVGWRRRGIVWSWLGRSPAVDDAIALCGLGATLAADRDAAAGASPVAPVGEG